MELIKKKVMVTGAAGLIGSHLIEKLIQLGYTVYGFDLVDLDSNNNLDKLKKKKILYILRVM